MQTPLTAVRIDACPQYVEPIADEDVQHGSLGIARPARIDFEPKEIGYVATYTDATLLCDRGNVVITGFGWDLDVSILLMPFV